MADWVHYENVVVCERGIFEVERGRVGALVPRDRIESVQLGYGTPANRPLVEGAIGVVLSAFGTVGIVGWLLGRFAISDLLFVMFAFGLIGAGMLYDVCRRRHLLLVSSDGRIQKLAFSKFAEVDELERFCEQARVQYGIAIEQVGRASSSR